MQAVDSAAITSPRMAGPTCISCHVCGWRGSCAALSSPPLNLRPFSTTLLPSRMAFSNRREQYALCMLWPVRRQSGKRGTAQGRAEGRGAA